MRINNWKYVDALEYCQKITDGTHDSPNPAKEGKPLITSKHIKGRNIDFENAYLISEKEYEKINQRSKVDQWDVIISMIGEYCGFCYVERNEDINYAVKNVGLFKTGGRIKADWLYYYLSSKQGRQVLGKIKSGSSQPYLTLGALRKLKILVPTNDETQEHIVDVLSSIDFKIELNNRINAKLEALAKTIYDYWFVQFDFPDKKGKPYKTSGGKMVWNVELKKEIPEGARKIKMSELYDFQYGFGNNNPDNGGPYPVYGSNGVIGRYDKFNNENAPVIGHIGNNCGSLVFADGKHYVTYNGVMCKIKNSFDKYFGYAVLLSKDLKSHTRGSSQQFISYDILNSFDVVVPGVSIMNKYCNFINPLFDNLMVNKKENQKLSELRDWLLPMLMNGQVKVKGAKEMLSIAAEPEVEYRNTKKK